MTSETCQSHRYWLDSLKILGVDGNTVTTSQTYTPTVTATMKGLASPLTDTAAWTVEGGKIKSGVFTWADPAAIDQLYVPAYTEAEEEVLKVFGNWGAGKYDGDAALQTAKEDFTADCTTVATPKGYTFSQAEAKAGYKDYAGPQGVVYWCAFLSKMEFPDFKMKILGVDGNTVTTSQTYTPTLKATKKGLSRLRRWESN